MRSALPRLVLAVVVLAACGKGGDKNNAKRDSGPTAPVATPIALPALGVEKLQRFNVSSDNARLADKAEAAAKKADWADARKQAEAAIAKDPHHYDAHWLAAIALAQLGEHAAAVDHLVTAIAADYYNHAPAFTTEPLLEGFRATQHGQAVTQLAAQIRDEYAKRITGALWFVGRRSAFRLDKSTGVQPLSSRGELYAFDRETKRYFRLTHTNHQAAGFLRARSGNEIAVLGYDKGDRPKDDGPPLIARAWVQTFDPSKWETATTKITFGPARAIAAHYGEGDQLLVGHAPAADRWALGAWTVSSVDRTTGKLTKVATALGAPRIELTLDEGRVVLPPAADGVQAVWSGDPARTPELVVGATKIPVPESGQAAQETVAVAPGGAHLAFATAVDPCAKDAAPSLYVATAKTGALKHLLTAKSRFATRWVDANTLAYEDGDGGIRLWDVTSRREALRIENKAGLALAVLSLASAPLCNQAPPVIDGAGSTGSGDEMPPEEGGGAVVAPQ